MHDAPARGTPVRYILENHMRKGALLLALVFAVAATSSASAAKKQKAAADPAVQAQRDTAAFLTDAFHPWAPTTPAPKARAAKKKKS